MTTICKLTDIVPETGVCALIEDTQVAIFRTHDDQIYAVDNHDPFSKANVLARGLLGSTMGEDGNPILYIASPIYKQRFDLATGKCLDDDSVSLNTYPVKLEGDEVVYS